MNPMQLASMLMQKNPNLANNPMAQQAMQILMSGDATKGAEFAENLCRSYGITKEQALQMAKQQFGMR